MSDRVVGVSDIIRESDICEDRLFWIFCVLCIGVSDLEVGVSDVGSDSLMCLEAACVSGGLTGPSTAVLAVPGQGDLTGLVRRSDRS